MRTILQEGLGRHAAQVGAYFGEGLRRLQHGGAPITTVRERGLMLAFDLSTESAAAVVNAARERGVLLNNTGPSTVRMVPPLILTGLVALFSLSFAGLGIILGVLALLAGILILLER